MQYWQKENMATMLITAGLVLGFYAMNAGAYSFWGLLLLLNLNTPVNKK